MYTCNLVADSFSQNSPRTSLLNTLKASTIGHSNNALIRKVALSETQQALVFSSSDKPAVVEAVPIADAIPGSAVVRILATTVSPNASRIYSGGLQWLSNTAPAFYASQTRCRSDSRLRTGCA